MAELCTAAVKHEDVIKYMKHIRVSITEPWFGRPSIRDGTESVHLLLARVFSLLEGRSDRLGFVLPGFREALQDGVTPGALISFTSFDSLLP